MNWSVESTFEVICDTSSNPVCTNPLACTGIPPGSPDCTHDSLGIYCCKGIDGNYYCPDCRNRAKCACLMNAPYFRLNHRIQMSKVWTGQSTYDWSFAKTFDHGYLMAQELLNIQQCNSLCGTNTEPLVTVRIAPTWIGSSGSAAINPSRPAQGLNPAYLSDLTNFGFALASQFPSVKNWEYGNEPDSDNGAILPVNLYLDNFVGAYINWGGATGSPTTLSSDPYYAGIRFGAELKAFSAGIKGANPSAKVWCGGLQSPQGGTNVTNMPLSISDYISQNVGAGYQTDVWMAFLCGILSNYSGSVNFDVIPIHSEWYYLNNDSKWANKNTTMMIPNAGTRPIETYPNNLYIYEQPNLLSRKIDWIKFIFQINGIPPIPISLNECAIWGGFPNDPVAYGDSFREAQVNWAKGLEEVAISKGLHSIFYYDDAKDNSNGLLEHCDKTYGATTATGQIPLAHYLNTSAYRRCNP